MKTLAEHMQQSNITDAALAEMANCDRSMITKIRNRQVTPSLTLALTISKITGVPVESLASARARAE